MAKVKLGDVAREYKQNNKNATGLPSVGLEHLTPSEIKLESWNEGAENTFTKTFKKGQMLFGRRRPYLKKAALAPFDGICSGDIIVIEAIPEKIMPELLPFLIQNDLLFDYAVGKSAGSLSPRVKWADLKNYEFELPEMNQQGRLTELLQAAYESKQAYQRLIQATDELVKAQFIEMFGNPVHNPLGWGNKKLIDVCTKLTDGTHFSPESFPEGDYKYITAKNIKEDGFDFTNLTYVTKDVHESIYARCNPEIGDVLYIKDGVTTGIAMVNSLDEPFTMLSSVALLKQDRQLILGEFLCSVLNNDEMYKSIRSNMGGAAITRLTIKKLNEIKIILPPLELQQKFVSLKEQADKSKFELQQAIEKIDSLMKSLIQQDFSCE